MVRIIVLILLLIMLTTGTHSCHKYLNILSDSKSKIEYETLLLSPDVLKVMTLGYDSLLADYFWLVTIQYYGGKVIKDAPMPQLYALCDIIITLDPKFLFAYIFAGYILTDWDNPTKAIQILEKGFNANPTQWELPYQMGYISYLYLKNYKQAAHYFEIAASLPEAPNLPARLAAMLYTKVGERKIAKLLWETALANAPDTHTREKIKKHIVELQIEDDLDTIKQAIVNYKIKKQQIAMQQILKTLPGPSPTPKTGIKQPKPQNSPSPSPPLPIPSVAAYPEELDELVKLGLLKQIPQDPLGRDYVYDQFTGEIHNQPLPWQKIKY